MYYKINYLRNFANPPVGLNGIKLGLLAVSPLEQSVFVVSIQ